MPDRISYEIVIKGAASARLLRPLIDDFIVHRDSGSTRLIGEIRDASHLHGLLAHLTAMNAQVMSLRPLEYPPPMPDSAAPGLCPTTHLPAGPPADERH